MLRYVCCANILTGVLVLVTLRDKATDTHLKIFFHLKSQTYEIYNGFSTYDIYLKRTENGFVRRIPKVSRNLNLRGT